MTKNTGLFAQGDIILRRVEDFRPNDNHRVRDVYTDAVILQEGEKTGHAHVLKAKGLQLYLQSGRPVPAGLFIGTVVVPHGGVVEHPEHAPITLAAGTYTVSRQRQVSVLDDLGEIHGD